MGNASHARASRDEAPAPPAARRWAQAWRSLPVRAGVLALLATALCCGRSLASDETLSAAAQVRGLGFGGSCRAAGPQLGCGEQFVGPRFFDASATAWQEMPVDYLLRNARLAGEPRPSWNPYAGSGYPLALDGITASTSPTCGLLSRVLGDQGRDVLAFVRFARGVARAVPRVVRRHRVPRRRPARSPRTQRRRSRSSRCTARRATSPQALLVVLVAASAQGLAHRSGRRLAAGMLALAAFLGPELDPALESGSVGAGAGRVGSLERRGDDRAYDLEVERAGPFAIADAWFRGWTATVNGRAAPISLANVVAFEAVLVPRGRVKLRRHFEPSWSRGDRG